MIRLTLGAIAVEIKPFTSSRYPRIQPNIAKLTYSANGTPLYDGSTNDPPNQWEIEAIVTDAQRLNLLKIYRRSIDQQADVLIEDYTQEQVDYGSQVRAEATGADVTTGGGYATYYAQYKGLFDSAPVFEIAGVNWRVQLVLNESSLVAA